MTLFKIGLIVRPHGIRGEVKVKPMVGWFDSLIHFKTFYLRQGNQEKVLKVEKGRVQHQSIIFKFSGLNQRDEAEALKGSLLFIDKELCPECPEDTYYIEDLIGSHVFTTGDHEVGFIIDVMHSPAQDIYIVRKDQKEIMIPAVKAFIKKVDINKKIVIIDPIPGLLDLDEY